MGREVRRVPPNWEHPRDANIEYIGLYDGSWLKDRVHEWEFHKAKWDEGLVFDHLNCQWRIHTIDDATSFEEWQGEKPDGADHMPVWAPEDATGYAWYESTTEGTPISPTFPTAQELAEWLHENEGYSNGSVGTVDEWLQVIRQDTEA